MTNSLLRILCLACLLFLDGYGAYYKDVAANLPHATLKFEGAWGLARAQTTIPMTINGMPSNGGRWTLRTFQITPGMTILSLHTARDGFHAADCVVKFEAIAGHVYTVTDKPDGDFFQITLTDDGGTVVASARPKKIPTHPPHEYYPQIVN